MEINASVIEAGPSCYLFGHVGTTAAAGGGGGGGRGTEVTGNKAQQPESELLSQIIFLVGNFTCQNSR